MLSGLLSNSCQKSGKDDSTWDAVLGTQCLEGKHDASKRVDLRGQIYRASRLTVLYCNKRRISEVSQLAAVTDRSSRDTFTSFYSLISSAKSGLALNRGLTGSIPTGPFLVYGCQQLDCCTRSVHFERVWVALMHGNESVLLGCKLL